MIATGHRSGPDAIVFQNGGYLYVLDLPDEKVRKLDISIPNDETLGMPKWVDASKDISSFDISPDGERAVFEARGDIFTLPKENGNTRNITNTSGVDERNPVWSPDGKYVAVYFRQNRRRAKFTCARISQIQTKYKLPMKTRLICTSRFGRRTARNCYIRMRA